MKKLFWAFLSLTLLFTACNDEEEIPLTETTDLSQEVFLYGTAMPDPQISQQGVAQNNKLWHPTAEIDVRFLDGTAEYQELVKTHVKEWEQYICVRFNFVESGDADVRIAFNWNRNNRLTWSYTGTDCKFVTDQSKPTVNFANWQSAAKTPEVKKGDVLRIFGQVLGLEYEYRHLEFNPMWGDEMDVEDYWMTYLKSFVPWNEFKKYVYDPLQASKVIQTAEYDPTSIMVMPINDDWVTENLELINATANNNLSDNDIAFIQQLYPNDACQEEDDAIITMKTINKTITFTLGCMSDVTIDWGDGIVETYTGYTPIWYSYLDTIIYDKNNITHTYESSLEHTIKIYANHEDLTQLLSGNQGVTHVNVSKCEELIHLNVYTGRLTELDLSNNKLLIHLECNDNKLTSLELPQNGKLKEIMAGANNLTSIDVSEQPNLERLGIGNCKLTSIDVSNNPKLKDLSCYMNNISTLDLSNNSMLARLSCGKNNITSLNLSNNTKLEYLECGENLLTNLNVANLTKLATLLCPTNKITSINLPTNGLLESINCSSNLLEDLNISNKPYLKSLSCYNNPLVSNNSAIFQIANQLPNRTSLTAGVFFLNYTLPTNVEAICINKNWIAR